ncbi:P-loop containing nucleoside triphosphate hydrolase protein [Suillus subalutaceus]|uniref:P-loop containing nucleoside triphosphate hydrolase protein n=1 Tax=Suillus subalutaceus TaxID=48586 RepID=UPI001B8793B0|nr:P-loop containing nucleoside triphosphate hydrolase protein [Suillus subalutaceus]KAG1862563.1 P-loop containing nucleoside triphosphate hydrolase protein [Suillus subalutaceus]
MSLRSFQSEIQEIHARELARQRGQGSSVAPAPRNIHARKIQILEESNIVGGPPPSRDAGVEDEVEAVLALLSIHDYDRARTSVAQLITGRKGEYIFRIGCRPSHASLFAGESVDDATGWSGVPRTDVEVTSLQSSVKRVVEELGGKISVLFETTDSHYPRATLLLRLPPPSIALVPEVRCAVVGNVDSGKSTTLGVLTRGPLDDGRGRARVALFRHKHEIETGRTSSVGMEILGFSTAGVPVLPDIPPSADADVIRRDKLGWDEISAQSAKIVSFSDLAGHERYLKTTLYGLTSGAPSCVILMVGANAGLIGMSKEHLAIALALSVPVVVCITKIDMTPPNILNETTKQVVKILKSPGCRKTPVFVNSMEVAVESSQTFAQHKLCPIFRVSNVTGEGLDYFRTFLNLLPSSEADTETFAVDQPLEYSVTDVWSVPYVGTVVNGILNSGSVKTGDSSTVVRSMQRKRADVATAEAGQCVALALKRVKRAAVRKGMVIVHKTDTPPKATRQFEGQVLILYHNTTMQQNYQAVRQTVRIISMDNPEGILRTGDRATVQFEFITQPEFVKVGMKLLFREGKTKGLGVITRLL